MDQIKPRVRVPAGTVAFPSAKPRPSAGYLRGLPESPTGYMHVPLPVLRDTNDDVRMAWSKAAARAIDALHNNGWIAGVTEQMVSLMIGEGLKPNIKPDFSWAGWDENQAGTWANMVERRFDAWASNRWACDAGGRYTFGQLQAAAVRQWFATGEIVAEVPFIRRPGIEWGTKIRLLPSQWLSQEDNANEGLRQGVFLDPHGAPAGYQFEIEQQGMIAEKIRKAARDALGRLLIVHIFDGAAGQVRGITPFASILRVLRDYDQLSNATLTASMLHAIFAATIQSDYPTAEILDALRDQEESTLGTDQESRFESFMNAKTGWHQNVNIDLGRHGKIAHLMMGEKLELNRSEHPNSTYEAFANFLLREIARASGALFEDLTGDYRGATYSSIRMGIAKQWPLLMYRRRHIPAPFAQAALEAFVEEEVDSGAIEVPGGIAGFLAHKSAICRTYWRGPAKPVADEVKAAQTHRLYREMGVITDEEICNDLGKDRDNTYSTRAYEKQRREELGIHGGITNGGTNIDEMDEAVNAAIDDRQNDQPAAAQG